MLVAQVLGQPLSRATVAWVLGVAGTTVVFRLIYPIAALFFAEAQTMAAGALVALSLVLAVARGVVTERATSGVRKAAYRAIGVAIEHYPVVVGPQAPPPEQIENEISRGVPWMEAYVAVTMPSLVGNVTGVLLLVALATWRLGLIAALLGTGALASIALAGHWTSRAASRAATIAWDEYQPIARLIEIGIRGRAEIRAHALSLAHGAEIASRVARWSQRERRAHLMAALTGWTMPAFVAVCVVGVAVLAGLDPLALVADSGGDPSRVTVAAGLIGMSALAAVMALARTLANAVLERPYVEALRRFVDLASAAVPTPSARTGRIGVIALEAVEYDLPSKGERRSLRAQLTWRESERLALVGENGCGKTTLSYLVLGLLEPTRGSACVVVDGTNCPPASVLGRVAYLPQHPYFADSQSVLDAIRFGAPAVGLQEIRELAQILLPTMAPEEILQRPVLSLSSGERRLIAILRVLLRRSELTVLDEPEANLDAASKRRVLEALAMVGPRRMLILTHDPDFAQYCERVVRFEQPLIVRDASPN